jgi:hypothetical protein
MSHTSDNMEESSYLNVSDTDFEKSTNLDSNTFNNTSDNTFNNTSDNTSNNTSDNTSDTSSDIIQESTNTGYFNVFQAVGNVLNMTSKSNSLNRNNKNAKNAKKKQCLRMINGKRVGSFNDIQTLKRSSSFIAYLNTNGFNESIESIESKSNQLDIKGLNLNGLILDELNDLASSTMLMNRRASVSQKTITETNIQKSKTKKINKFNTQDVGTQTNSFMTTIINSVTKYIYGVRLSNVILLTTVCGLILYKYQGGNIVFHNRFEL